MANRKTVVKRIKGGVVVERAAPGPAGWVSRAEYFRDEAGVVRLRTKAPAFFVAPRVGHGLAIVDSSRFALRAGSAEELLQVVRKAAGNRSTPDSETARLARGETLVLVKEPRQ